MTSVAAYGGGELHALSPGPFILSYDVVGPDRTIDVVIRWDHRITDAAFVARVMTRLEQVLNTDIAAELRGQAAGGAKTGPGGRDLKTGAPNAHSGPVRQTPGPLLHLTGQAAFP